MTDRILQIRIRPIGQEAVTRAVRGISATARQAGRQQIAETQRAERARVTSERNATREAQRGAQARARADRDAQRSAQREAARTAQARERATRDAARVESAANREAQREANDLFRLRMRLHQRRVAAERQAQRQRVGREAVVFGTATAGATALATAAVMGGLDAITRRLETITAAVGTRAGVQDVGQRTATAQDFELALAQASGEFFQGQSASERTASRAQLTQDISGTALATGQDPTELLHVLATMQSEFSQLDVGRRDLRAIADEAQRTGADMIDLARFVGVLNQQLGETAPTAEQAFNIMAQAGLEGAITPESFAQNFGGMLGQFQASSGAQGEDALRQFSALAQIIRPGAQSDAEAATQLHGLIAALQNPRTRQHIQEAMGGRRVGRGASAHVVGGSDAFRADGTVDYARLIEDMSTIQNTARGSGVASALRQAGARDAMTSLTRAQRHEVDSPDFATLMAVDAGAAAQWRSANLSDVQGTSAFDARQLAVQGQIEGIQQLRPRATGAIGQLGFNEAVTQTGSEGLIGAIGAITPDIVTQRIVPELAQMISGMSGERRSQATQLFEHLGMTGAAMPVMGPALGMGFAGASRAFTELGGIGDRQRALATERQVAIAPGSSVELGQTTVDRISRGVAAAIPAAAPSASGGRGGARRTPIDDGG